jgi:hypothetical protein
MKTAHQKALEIQYRNLIPPLDTEQITSLVRASRTLHRWGEEECGDSNNFCSWHIERDEKTDIPYRVTIPNNGKERRQRIPDRERGALKRIAAICQQHGLHYFHQTDPRGMALYVSSEPLTDSNYTRGVAIG